MTIPIRPGPFSFLVPAGQAVGGYLANKERKRQTARQEGQEDRAEALKQVGLMFDAVQAGQLSTGTLKSPFFLEMVKRSGLGEAFQQDFVAPKPEEAIRQEQSEFLQGMFGGGQEVTLPGQAIGGVPQKLRVPTGTPAERRLTISRGRIVTPGEVAQEREAVAVSGARARAAEAGGAVGRAVTGVPAENVAVAGEVAAQEPLYNSIALRSVDAAITRGRVDRLTSGNIGQVADQAWQIAENDAKSRGFVLDKELTRPYIDAMLASRMREQQALDLQREAVRARAAQTGGSDYDKYLRLYQEQQRALDRAEDNLADPSETDMLFASTFTSAAARAGQTPEEAMRNPKIGQIAKDAYSRVQAWQAAKAQLAQERQNLGDNFTQLIGGVVGVPDPSAVPVQSSRRGPGFASPPAPGVAPLAMPQGQPSAAPPTQPVNARRSQRLRQLVAEEMRKPQGDRRPQQDLVQQVLQEIPE